MFHAARASAGKKLVIFSSGSGNGQALSRHQTITWTNVDLSIRPSTNFSEIQIQILYFYFNKINCKMLSADCYPFCFHGLSVLWCKSNITRKIIPGFMNIATDCRRNFHWSLIPTVNSSARDLQAIKFPILHTKILLFSLKNLYSVAKGMFSEANKTGI